MYLDSDKIKTYTEIAKNTVETLGILSSPFILYKWLVERRDHSTQVLFDLEKQFNSEDVSAGRRLVEDDARYAQIRKLLLEQIVPEEDLTPGSKTFPKNDRFDRSSPLQKLDALLRFYVLVYGIRSAGQVSDSALRACYRFYLAHYYSPSRRELRLYIHTYYPTLRGWLLDDRRWRRRKITGTFFTPEQFGWHPELSLSSEQLERSLNGRIFVVVGAGLSADSGLSTFRSADGYWEKNDPRTLATQHAFDTNRERVWNWYIERRKLAKAAQPNAGHFILAKLAALATDCLIVTQNVDNLHERAGTDPKHLIHIHGDIFTNKCGKCSYADREEVNLNNLPVCPEQGTHGHLRPGVVWFAEDLDSQEEKKIDQFLDEGECDLVLAIGTSATFNYIVDWTLRAAGNKGFLVEINPQETTLSPAANLLIRRPAAQALPELFERALAVREAAKDQAISPSRFL
jgi:NAD-dependent protein deacetylase/lipoamidase